jgi:peptidoglycan hydrolase-like protein with peptidoglycan-binding domain
MIERGVFNEQLHPRGKGAQGGQFVAKGSSGSNDTVGYDARRGTGAGYGTGGKGDARVKQLQQALNKLGFTDAAGHPLLVDGKLGPRTTASIKKMQRKLGLKADGLVTPALLSRIRKAAAGGKAGTVKKVVHTKKPAAKKAAPAPKAPAKPAKPPRASYSGHGSAGQ